jgi:hypothetical protein
MAEMLIDTPCSRPIFLVCMSPIEVDMQLHTCSTQATIASPPPLAAAVRGLQAEEARRLPQLEKENARFKKLLAEAWIEKAML